ncbi:MAG: hypothetical protein ACSLE9_08030 [Burkholderiaceae bacterium]
MPAPTGYATEAALQALMVDRLGEVGAMLGWTVSNGKLDEPVNDTLLALGVSTIGAATNVRQVRALATLFAWRAAVRSLPAFFDFQSADETFNRSQVMKAAASALAAAEADAAPYGVGAHVAYLDAIDRTQDPYEYYPADDGAA